MLSLPAGRQVALRLQPKGVSKHGWATQGDTFLEPDDCIATLFVDWGTGGAQRPECSSLFRIGENENRAKTVLLYLLFERQLIVLPVGKNQFLQLFLRNKVTLSQKFPIVDSMDSFPKKVPKVGKKPQLRIRRC